jgi:mono/diheme cytochrome c family protein
MVPGLSLLLSFLVAVAGAAGADPAATGDRSGGGAVGQRAPAAQATRGEMLYATHCRACHTEQIHWRERKLVSDWRSLQAQVRRWAANTSLGWNDDDVADVARYLNRTVYRFPASPGSELGARHAFPAS